MTQSVSATAKRELGVILVMGAGIGAVAIHLSHAASSQEDAYTFLLGIFIPLVFGVGLVVGGVWLSRSRMKPEYVLRIGLWTVFMGIVVAGGQFMTVLYQQAEGGQLSHILYVLANAGTAGGIVGFVIGIYNARQQRARHRAEHLQGQLTVLNRVLRHDIRNGATVIQGHADLVSETDSRDEHADRIRQQAQELVKLGQHARTIEKLQREQDAPREPFDVGSSLEEHITRFEIEYPDANIEASLACQRKVYAHPMIDIAIEHLLENAIEHTDEPDPTVRVTCQPVRERLSTAAEIRIADTGPGIPPDEVTVLERGYETPLDHTSGLGLWLVNWIVTQSDGEVWFEENTPSGSIVCIRLDSVKTDPLADPMAAANWGSS